MGLERNLLEKSLLAVPRSCDGDPLPDLVLFAMLPDAKRPLERLKEDRLPDGKGSIGELFAEGELERGCPWFEECEL
jgi:hypothetical protein